MFIVLKYDVDNFKQCQHVIIFERINVMVT